MITGQMPSTIPHESNLLLNLKSGGALPTKGSLCRRVKEEEGFIVMFADHRRIPSSIDQFRPRLTLGLFQQESNSVGHGGRASLTHPPIEDEFFLRSDGD